MQGATMTIGALAEKSSVGVETIRYYEREGLLPKPARSHSGYRVYPDEAVERVRFIRRAKDLGFTLDEISELLALKVTHGKSCRSVRDRGLAKLADIDRKMNDLRRMRRALSALVDRCSGDEGIDDCTILDAISRGTKPLVRGQHGSAPRRKGSAP
ncbi:MAG: MerR family transcriptional regulator [Labilithrix sp.]|nr:MerR family transcriptional regulator [Labilithrix sp.]MBX3215203.1 MerR family transcriptional regulator [Labilithrix sp.]